MTPLARIIAAEIAGAPGQAIGVARYMALASGHPEFGYYAAREPFGPAGDFVTAPEISQMFGELVGAWCADVWVRAGSPPRVRLVELGPGRGTLLRDLWRATAPVPGFHAAARVHLVETSARLRGVQAGAVPGAVWHDALSEVPDDAPLLLVANEFFDALPVEQHVSDCHSRESADPSPGAERSIPAFAGMTGAGAKSTGDRTERMVRFAGDRFVADAADPACIHETSPAALAVAAGIGDRLRAHGGAALIVDYGYSGPATGDTLQALRDGAPADPFADPGEADLTAHVDFAALAAAAGVATYGPVPQGVWLRRLGIEARAAALKARADLPARAAIAAAATRLTSASGMGASFKVLALTGPGWPEPAGFAA